MPGCWLLAAALLAAALPAPPALSPPALSSPVLSPRPGLSSPPPPALSSPQALPPSRPCASNPLCVCSDDHLACSHVPFHRFPETEAGVRHVSLWRARLGALDEAALDARRLRTLVLVACRLLRLHPAALASMETTLASLDLGFNEFTELPIESLRGLKVLNWLNLQNNQISELEENTDWGHLSESLTSLTLSNNHLSALPAGALGALRRLTRLDLDGNVLRALAPAALPPALVRLRLAGNLLARVPCRLLASLPRLRHLQLRDNLLRAPAPDDCLVDHSKVDSLDLSQNELDDLSRFDFLTGLQVKQLVLDLNDFTRVPSFPPEGVRLERLSLSHNRVRDLSEDTVHALKHSLEHFDLDHNELSALPAGVRDLARLRHLSVAYNRLEELDALPPRLSSLSAAGNYLSRLPLGLRRLAAGLVRLDLGYNRIAVLSRDAFGAWAAALASLDLRGNRLTRLSPDVFPASLPVRELTLSFNDLYFVDLDVFANLTTLRVLELSSTLFDGEFPRGVVSPDLTWLTLDNNNIHRVTSGDLYGFASLEYLNLDFNKIVAFPSESNSITFAYTSSKLRELRLSYNNIRRVNPNFLMTLTELESVDLSYNRMQNVSERCFAGLRNLVYANLAGNLLESVAERAFHDLPKLEVLDLHENFLTELSTYYFSDVSSEEITFAVNVSHNRISSLAGGSTVFIAILDLSHNLLDNLPRGFFESLGRSIRQILLAHNRLVSVDSLCFGTLPNLQILNLSNNSIGSIKRRVSAEAPSLQVLDLSHNRLALLAAGQFQGARRLRLLRLDHNELRALPRDCFRHTLLEHLDLGHNRLAVFPGGALAHVGFTLRRLELAGNRVERLDSAEFRAISFLHELNLARNALTVLPDNTFAGLARLTRLDLSHNAVESNFRELFHNLPGLRRLALADAGLEATPPLPLGNLTHLDLSGNRIASLRETDVGRLADLRQLNIARNRLTALRPAAWAALPRLSGLDVSGNPLARVPGGALDGLERLLRLRMERLERLQALEPRSFRALRSLRALALEAPDGGPPPAAVLAALPGLEALTLTLRARELDAQLRGVRAPKLRELELRGAALRTVAAHALDALGRRRALALRLSGTGLARLPPGLLRPLAGVPHLALDLSDDRLLTFEPAALYPNLTDWNRLATKLLSGGLVVSGARLRCGCAVSWAGAWLRRWAAEVGGGSAQARAAARRSSCATARGRVPLLAAEAEAAGDAARCGASALAARAAPAPAPAPAPALLWLLPLPLLRRLS